MNPLNILYEAGLLIDERGLEYGGIEQSFTCAAALSTLKLNKDITPYDVATILESVKDARLAANPTHWDSFVDGINYRAFRAILSGAVKPEVNPAAAAAAYQATAALNEEPAPSEPQYSPTTGLPV